LREPRKNGDEVKDRKVEVERMSEGLLLEEEHRLLKKRLSKNLNEKRAIESAINTQFEKLKKLEICLEKTRGNRCGSSELIHYALLPE
jgi:hypothetical protein